MAEFKPVVFKLDKELYGVDIDCVQAIEKDQQVVCVPNAAFFFKGMMNLRGDDIPVYSLRKKFGFSENTPEEVQYVIVKTNGILVALEVDNVDEIHGFEDKNVHDMPSIIMNEGTDYYDKVLKTDKGLVITIDVAKLLSDEELENIAAMKDAL